MTTTDTLVDLCIWKCRTRKIARIPNVQSVKQLMIEYP